ncbi:hypothetical protein N7492_010599 [Penicillium capsulatum]|uniref:Cytoplasmic tRNA 2-thiolation protein 2 n=1 Tax=Penicillium capsulatum TaxID=69766 RepID=A0A9W9LF26_9EURO|nr:hypothetical protein N7492_010599 [Penicillium capsulatum]KAJ6113098.1 hypothetical protein N7512_008422 [Penicillium capsulatum]
MPAKDLSSPCMECKDAEAVLTIRRRQFCGPCFQRFISYKVLRRMEKYKSPTNTDQRTQLLLPLSLGVSSSVLLHILDSVIQHQRSKPFGKVAFDLHVLVIEPSTVVPSDASHDSNYELLQKTFPSHKYTKLPLHSIFEYVPEMANIMAEYAGSGYTDDKSKSNEDRLAAFCAAISTATSKADVDSVLLTRLIVTFAKHMGCSAVVWGDSDSRLAAKTLAGASKGRGASLTWQVSDGMSPWGVNFDFPLRDMSKPELLQYESVCEILSGIVIPEEALSENVLTKNMSIDELMMRYVQNQGEKYPGVMANVSRTANKLQPAQAEDSISCYLCGSLVGNVKGNTSGITTASQFGTKGSPFCYGCARSRPESS